MHGGGGGGRGANNLQQKEKLPDLLVDQVNATNKIGDGKLME